MHDGTTINDLLGQVDSVLNRHLPRTQDSYADLCEAKTSLADEMARQIHDYGKESPECRQLWFEADKLQDQVIRDESL